MSFGTSRSFTIDCATSDDSSAPSVSSVLKIIYYTFFLEDSKRHGRVLNGKYGCILTFCPVTGKEILPLGYFGA
jgi:hypothetical protein